MLTIQAINNDPQALSVSPPKSIKGGMKIANVNYNKRPISVQLAPDLNSVSPPSLPAFGEAGNQTVKAFF